MGQPQIQNCVLCQRPAEFRWADYRERKHFFCDHCTEYQITDTAERKLSSAPEEWRKGLSEKARSLGEETVLVISVPNVPRPEGMAHESLRGEPVQREKLPSLENGH